MQAVAISIVVVATLSCGYATLPTITPPPLPPPPPGLPMCPAAKARKAEELRAINEQGTHVDGWHDPKCDENGLWEREQEWTGLNYATWCVNPLTGEEEELTRLTGDEARNRPIPCGAVA